MSRLSVFYVVLQFVISAALVLSVDWRTISVAAGVVSCLGALISAWAVVVIRPRRVSVAPEVHADAALVTRGPYRWIRHPMYTGLAMFTLGFVLTPLQFWKSAAWVALLVILHQKAALEEKLLAERFPDYARYRVNTKRFLPYLY